MPVFFVAGVKMLIPVQGHAVQFWPVFLSRIHLISWISRAHDALALAWLARRRAARKRQSLAAQARVARFFAWCRSARASGGPPSAPTDAELDDDMSEPSEEPSEVKDLMNELSTGGGGGDPDNSLVISIGPSGFGKSVELVAMGAVAVVAGAAEQLAAGVDSVMVALWGMRALLGLQPRFSVQACCLGEAAQAARAWNDVAAPSVRAAMHSRWQILQQEVDDIMAVLTEALQEAEADASPDTRTTIQLTVTPGHVSASRGPLIRRLFRRFGRRGQGEAPGEAQGAAPQGSSDDRALGEAAPCGTSSEQAQQGSSGGYKHKEAHQRDSGNGVEADARGGGQESAATEVKGSLSRTAADDSTTSEQPGTGIDSQSRCRSAVGQSAGIDDAAADATSAEQRTEQKASSPGALEWRGGTEGSRRFWRRRRNRGEAARRDAGQQGSDSAESRVPPQPQGGSRGSGSAADADGVRAGDNESRPTPPLHGDQRASTQGAWELGQAPHSSGASTSASCESAEGTGSVGEEDTILPRGVSENIRSILKRVVSAPSRRLTSLQGVLKSAAADWAGGSTDGGTPDADQMHSLRSGAEVDSAGAQINEERAAALAAAATAPTPAGAPLRDRLADFLSLAIAERRALVENMLAAQRSVERGDVSPATLRELRRDERASRVRLMRSLLAMGSELAAATGERDAPALRTTWITSVNSLLAIDQASGLSPLLPSTAMSTSHVKQLRAAPATLNFVLSAACTLHAAARRNPHSLSLLLEPAATLFDVHRSCTLHSILESRKSDKTWPGAFTTSTVPPSRGDVCGRDHSELQSSRGPGAGAVSGQSSSAHPRKQGVTASQGPAGRPQEEGSNVLEGGRHPSSAATDGESDQAPRRLWRVGLDALMPPASRLDSHNSVAVEVDLDQLFGVSASEMLQPELAAVGAEAPGGQPEFRGLLVVGDIAVEPSRHPGARDFMLPGSFESHFGYIGPSGLVCGGHVAAGAHDAAGRQQPPGWVPGTE